MVKIERVDSENQFFELTLSTDFGKKTMTITLDTMGDLRMAITAMLSDSTRRKITTREA